MPDDLERQLEAFGRTLASQTGEPIAGSLTGSPTWTAGGPTSSHRRRWAMLGAAACLLAVVGGLVMVGNRDEPHGTSSPPNPTPVATGDVPTATSPPTVAESTVDEPVVDDPLGLERDGWSLVQRTTAPFDPGEILCDAANGLAEFGGITEVHDILTPPDGTGLDLDVQVLDVGSIERGHRLAEVMTMIGRCAAESQGVEGEIGALSSVRASWFRAGPDFALVTIVGEGERSIVLEIEGAPFDDDLIGDLAHRADTFLRGDVLPIVSNGDVIGDPERDPESGELLLWMSNQSFDDDPIRITVSVDGRTLLADAFYVEGQHNWISWLVTGLGEGDHTIVATSDTGATFEGRLTIDGDAPRWAVLDYWFSAGDDAGRYFTYDESDEPIVFG